MTRHRSESPSLFLERVIGGLLPRSRREHVLGDLAERFSLHPDWPSVYYLLDAVTAIVPLWWSVIKQSFRVAPPPLTAASTSAIHQHTENFQRQITNRTHVCNFFVFCMIMTGRLSPERHPSITQVILLLGFVYSLYVLPVCRVPRKPRPLLPASMSPGSIIPTRSELITLHRQILEGQLNWELHPFKAIVPPALVFLIAVRFVPWPSVFGNEARPWLVLFVLVVAYAVGFIVRHSRAESLRTERRHFDSTVAAFDQKPFQNDPAP